MTYFQLFTAILASTSISGAVVVFILNRIIRYDQDWLSKVKDIIGKEEFLENIFRKRDQPLDKVPGNEVTDKKKWELWQKLNKKLENYNKNTSLVSHSVWDNTVDIATADINRIVKLLLKYKEYFEEVFGRNGYTYHFYRTKIFENKNLKYKCHDLSRCIITMILSLSILLIFITGILTLNDFSCKCCFNMAKYFFIILLMILSISVQIFLIVQTQMRR